MKNHLLSILALSVIAISLCNGQNPTLYGITHQYGSNRGTIFSYNISTGKEKVIHNFSNTYSGSLICARNGLLYGMNWNGGVYGGGTIFSYDISTGEGINIFGFGDYHDGKQPYGSLIQASNGLLYGMTAEGGADNYGTIFSYNISTGKETVLHDFSSNQVQDPFSYNISTITATSKDGQNPFGSLIQASNGLLYGVTQAGGTYGTNFFFGGTIISYNISTGTEIVIHNFANGTDGYWPQGSLIQANNGLLYGMTKQGGINKKGIIFSYDISTGKENDLHDFGKYNDGQSPYQGALIQANNGLLYGVTSEGGIYKYGTIFSYDITTGTETVIHNFGNGTDGQNPYGSLIQASNGLLYGTTEKGGTKDSGTIFNYNISTGMETDVHNFIGRTDGGNDVISPQGNMIEIDSTMKINQLPVNNDK